MHKIISKCQKGGTKFEGCIEHNAIPNAVLEDVRQSHRSRNNDKSVYIAWLEIKAAFRSVPHLYMLECLMRIWIGKSFINVIESLYNDTTSNYRCFQTITHDLPIKVALKQDCLLFMMLFNIAINPIIRSEKNLNIAKYDLHGMKVQCLAYANMPLNEVSLCHLCLL